MFARENLYYDTCAFSKSFIEMAVGEIGIDRFMFGTDLPDIIAYLSYIAALDLPDGDKDKIFGGNAQRLFAKRLAIL